MRWPFRKKNPSHTSQPVVTKDQVPLQAATSGAVIADEWLTQMALVTGDVERPGEAPGWALLLRSPFVSVEGATSWLGGTPYAPSNFVWPQGEDGVLLHFLAQIDLASVKYERSVSARPEGILRTGALLVFIGKKEHAVVTLSEAEMADACLLPLPTDLPSIRDIGHWNDTATFDKWPVDVVPFLDNGAQRPEAFPDPWLSPSNWITTWAIALAEAEIVLAEIDKTRRQAVLFRRKKQPVTTADDSIKAKRAAEAKEQQSNYFRRIGSPEFRKFHATLRGWRDAAANSNPAGPVDIKALDGLFVLRRRHAQTMPNYMLKLLLNGRHQSLWDNVRRHHGKAIAERQFQTIPAEMRPFVDMVVTDWRGHQLFGLVKDLWHNSEDRRGQDVLIIVHSDELLATQMEHDHAISVWCARQEMTDGRYARGQIIRHSNG